jgi:(1->4)-alpha-D-glucan 1-alpha-D-glucosylmutase
MAEVGALDGPEKTGAFIANALRNPGEGALKMLVLSRVLAHRRRQRACFDRGAYIPLQVEGEHARHVVAYARGTGEVVSITVVGRLLVGLGAATQPPVGAIWGDTRIRLPETVAAERFREVVTGETLTVGRGGAELGQNGDRWIRLSNLFVHLPVAVLEQHSAVLDQHS